jgi:hypothetical protein
MREAHQGSTDPEIQVTSVTIGKGEELIVEISNDPEKPLIYKKIAKETSEPVIHVLIDSTLLLRTLTDKLTECGHE